jgi:hypothetical protein
MTSGRGEAGLPKIPALGKLGAPYKYLYMISFCVSLLISPSLEHDPLDDRSVDQVLAVDWCVIILKSL